MAGMKVKDEGGSVLMGELSFGDILMSALTGYCDQKKDV